MGCTATASVEAVPLAAAPAPVPGAGARAGANGRARANPLPRALGRPGLCAGRLRPGRLRGRARGREADRVAVLAVAHDLAGHGLLATQRPAQLADDPVPT